MGKGITLKIAALSSAVAMIQTRRLTQSEPTGAIVFYFSAVTSALSAALLVAAALWPFSAPCGAFAATRVSVAPDVREFVALATIGVLGGMGRILMTHSCRFADASILAAFDYVAMIWAAALGLMFFAETPTPILALARLSSPSPACSCCGASRRGDGSRRRFRSAKDA